MKEFSASETFFPTSRLVTKTLVPTLYQKRVDHDAAE